MDGCAQKHRLDRASTDLLVHAWQVAPQESRALVGQLTASLRNPSAYLMNAASAILADRYWGDAQAEGARCRGEVRPSGELTDAERQEYWDYDCQAAKAKAEAKAAAPSSCSAWAPPCRSCLSHAECQRKRFWLRNDWIELIR